MPGAGPLARLRTLALALPEAHEVEAWGEPTFRVRGKIFAMYASASSHHGGGRPAVWLKASPGNQGFMVAHAPRRFFVPPYVGPSGWVGVWLDEACDWREMPELLEDAWSLVAPKRVVAQRAAPAPAATKPAAKATTPSVTKAKAATKQQKKQPAKRAAKKTAATRARTASKTPPSKRRR